MITGASLTAPLILGSGNTLSSGELAAIVVAIASGASILSHVGETVPWYDRKTSLSLLDDDDYCIGTYWLCMCCSTVLVILR